MPARSRSAHAATALRPRMRRAAVPVLVALVLGLDLAVGGGALGAAAHRSAPGAGAANLTVLDQLAVQRGGLVARGTTGPYTGGAQPFVGIDGITYDPSYPAVPGTEGTFFIGEDFDTACQLGAKLSNGMNRIRNLATMIEKSGRTVLFAVAPNKSAVEGNRLIDPLPHDVCSQVGLADQLRVLDSYDDPRFVPLRRQLSKTPDPFWKTDAHWSTVGASVFAEQVAKALSPRLARKQRYTNTSRTRVGDLMMFTQSNTPETAPARLPDNGVVTTTAPGSADFDPTLSTISFDHSWVSTPAKKTWGGSTLLLGDSFTYTALEPLRNLFARGRFLWLGFNDPAKVVDAVVRADTVVLTVVQRYINVTPLLDNTFRAELNAALERNKK